MLSRRLTRARGWSSTNLIRAAGRLEHLVRRDLLGPTHIELRAELPSWKERRQWARVAPGLDVRLDVPPLRVPSFGEHPPRVPANAGLTFALVVRNARGLAQASPDLGKLVRQRLLSSPEVLSRHAEGLFSLAPPQPGPKEGK